MAALKAPPVPTRAIGIEGDKPTAQNGVVERIFTGLNGVGSALDELFGVLRVSEKAVLNVNSFPEDKENLSLFDDNHTSLSKLMNADAFNSILVKIDHLRSLITSRAIRTRDVNEVLFGYDYANAIKEDIESSEIKASLNKK